MVEPILPSTLQNISKLPCSIFIAFSLIKVGEGFRKCFSSFWHTSAIQRTWKPPLSDIFPYTCRLNFISIVQKFADVAKPFEFHGFAYGVVFSPAMEFVVNVWILHDVFDQRCQTISG